MSDQAPQTPMPTSAPQAGAPRDVGHWASKVDRLGITGEASPYGYNVVGRKVAGPQQGFGRMWQRTYTVDLGSAVAPAALVADWRSHFGDFWPKGGIFHGALTGIEPGDVAPLEVGAAHGPKLATGVLVLYADDEAFTFITPEGHMFAGLITFSAEDVAGSTQAQVRILMRTSDPLFEAGWPVMRRGESTFWKATLRNVAASHGVRGADPVERTECVDPHRLWRNWTNVRHNAAIRSVLHLLTRPLRRPVPAT